MVWAPQSFQPETPFDKNAVINDLYPQAIPSTNFQDNAQIMPAAMVPVPAQPWTPQTFMPLQPEKPAVVPPTEPTLGDKINARGQQGRTAMDAYVMGDQTGAETALQVLGNAGLGTINDVVGAGAKKLIDNMNGPLATYNKYAISQLADSQLGRGIGDAAKYVGDQYGEFTAENPRAGRNLGALGNIATALPIGKAKEPAGAALAEVGGAIEQSGIKSAATRKNNFINDLILPKATPSEREAMVGRTKEVGFNRRKEVQLTPQEQEMADTVSQIKGVKKGNSLQGNYNAVQDANHAEADSLIANLQKNNVTVPDDVIVNGLDAVRNRLSKNPYLAGADASKSAEAVTNQALEIIMKQPRTASGLLQARKDLDAWVKSQRPNVFDAADSPVSTAVREVRQEINDMVANAVPNADVRASLRKQSNLYRVQDNIATKAKDEAGSRLGRAAQNIGKGVSLKQGIAGTAALAGLGAAGIAGPVLGAGLGLYSAKKAVTSPALRRLAGGTIRRSGELIK